MNLSDGLIGIWGLGIGGKALKDFLRKSSQKILIFDQRALAKEEVKELDQQQIEIAPSLESFLERSHVIIPSAGVDLRPFNAYSSKFIAELDLFHQFFNKPIIAITGTLGKTTVTTCLASLLERAGKRVAVGGNIGIGLCSLIEQQDKIDYAVLEVSSFQLEQCKQFAPAVAVWTNFFPNHLDRHDTVEDYFAAKSMIVRYQKKDDIAVIPEQLLTQVTPISLHEHRWYVIPEVMPEEWRLLIAKQKGIADNWRILCATLHALKIPLAIVKEPVTYHLEHRLEFVATVEGRHFYNDSKATVSESTLAAVEQLQPAPLILLLGGLGKGVSREPLIKKLKQKIKCVICFGAEVKELSEWCKRHKVHYKTAHSFDESVKIGYTYSSVGDVILLSPSGSSFDQFRNYQERGKRFKEIVSTLKGTE